MKSIHKDWNICLHVNERMQNTKNIEILHFFHGNLDAFLIAYFRISMLLNKMESIRKILFL